ncbi:MAG TPA: tetratricopeptide repeat protein [Rhizomicrobium sp.]|nr:tetratricopeptide repeat protein [Rhizomicrobium sp.]
MTPQPALQQALALAALCLQRRDVAGAERAMAPFSGAQANLDVLNIMGAIRLHQGRFAEAAVLLERVCKDAPRDPAPAYNLGRALAGLGRLVEAIAAHQAAIRLKPDFVEARFEAGHLLHRTGNLAQAEHAMRELLRIAPGNVHAKLALGAVLVDAGRPEEAEAPLRRALRETADPGLQAQLHLTLGMALRRQRKDEEALAACESAEALTPGRAATALHRSEALQNLGRHDEALAILENLLARAPDDPGLHHSYNDLLYRLGRTDLFLKSYDRVPESRPLLLGKAFFLRHAGRDAEGHAVYARLLARDPADRTAAIGAARSLARMKRTDEAVAAFDAILAKGQADAGLFAIAAESALLHGDPGKAAWQCEQGLALDRYNGACLSMLSIASRMLEDGRDETINGYGTLVRSFDLEPPAGFPDMASFNAELDAALGRLHPDTREFIGQSLRGGTQTSGRLFDSRHALVGKLRERIDEAVRRYMTEMKDDADHPFLSRRTRDFRYSGSWSSRLRDCGFHVNHIHPDGWISSCYYVAVPPAVRDGAGQQGWIKFGEPSPALTLREPVRRTIQPAPGRLVLFPSYMWHGTIPFHDDAARTTIAFDVVPAG